MKRFASAALTALLLFAGVGRAANPAGPAKEGPFDFKQTPLMKDAPPAVFVAFMGDYRTSKISGNWGAWADAGKDGKHHNPDQIKDGKRDIAARYYPAIGPYDMSDPDLVDYQCQLLKMAGIDGVSFNLSFFEHDPWRRNSMKLYVAAMQKYGLKGIVRFENKYFARTYPDPTEAVAKSYADMDAWLKLMDPVQYRVDGQPVLMLFTFALTPQQLKSWKDSHPANHRPIIVTFGADPKFKDSVDGRFGWTGDQPQRVKDHPPYNSYIDPPMIRFNERHDRERAAELLDSGQISFYIGGVSPGFDDVGCWGWGKGPRFVDRDDGKTYQYRWEQLLRTNLHVAFIATWNDWNEGTNIEPAAEFGDQYVAMTRDYSAKFKKQSPISGNLHLPQWIYQVRKGTKDAQALRAMNAATDANAAGDFAKAESIVAPLAEKTRLNKSN